MRVEWKGGSGEFYSKTIIFTSNFDIKDWFPKRFNRSALLRRISQVRYFVTPDTDTEVEGGNTSPLNIILPEITNRTEEMTNELRPIRASPGA